MRAKVWAPFARSIHLMTPGHKVALQGETCGYWQAEIDEALLEQGYRYSIDGAPPVPDPRSQWQPEGVHGASHTTPALRSSGPLGAKLEPTLQGAVIYEMHVGTFTPEGTYAAAAVKLAHLVALGVTHIELMPLATFPGGRGWGYDGVDLFAPFPAYGTPQQLAAFIDAIHAQGLFVLLDVVYNHLGPDGNYLSQYGPYFTDRYSTSWGAAINYDGPYSDGVRRLFIDNALMWLGEYGFDGLRLDAVHAIFSFDAVHVLEELAVAVKKLGNRLGRAFVLIAESDSNDPRLVRSRLKGGLGLDAHWADDFHHAIHRFFTGEKAGYYADFSGLADLATALRDGYVYQGQYSVHRHKRHGRSPSGVAPHQLVVFAQNHDQIGNRAHGERLSMMLEVPQLKAIAALTLLSPYAALLFQGEEWGARTPFLYFTDHQNGELGRSVAEGRRREFSSFEWQGAVPDPQDLNTFIRSRLDWSELAQPRSADLYAWYCALIRLRREFSKAGRQKSAVEFDIQRGWLRSVRGDLCLLMNFAAQAQRVPEPRGKWVTVLRSDRRPYGPVVLTERGLDGTDVIAGNATWVQRRNLDEPIFND